jgi:hypothetical protein
MYGALLLCGGVGGFIFLFGEQVRDGAGKGQAKQEGRWQGVSGFHAGSRME